MFEIVLIGTSWGGLSALSTILGGLPADFEVPVAIIQHRHRASDGALRQILQDRTALRVCDIEDKSPLAPGHVFVAPPDYHTLVEHGFFSLSTDPPVRFSRPSIDVTFISAADAFGARTVGVILTGANEDGAQGLQRVADRGGRAIVQDPLTAESPIMPRAALGLVRTARVLPLHEIAPELARLARGGEQRIETGDREAGRREAGLGARDRHAGAPGPLDRVRGRRGDEGRA